MRERLMKHDFLVPFALFLPLALALMAGYEQLGLSRGAMGWLVVGFVAPIVFLHEFMYKRGRGRGEQ